MQSFVTLASASPRRRNLLAAMGIAFDVQSADIDETPCPGEDPERLVRRLSAAKAEAVAGDGIIIAADTVVVADGRVLGKPNSAQEATRTLCALRGRSHQVFSGLAVLDPGRDRACVQVATSPVRMRDYCDDEIAAYVASGDPMDKAGAYAIQHQGFSPVAAIEGCYANVMGFPICHLYRLLTAWEMHAPVHPLDCCPLALQEACPYAEGILTSPLPEGC